MKLASYLENFTLRTFLEQQRLLIQRIERLSSNLGFLFGFARTVFQQIDLDVGSWKEQIYTKRRVQAVIVPGCGRYNVLVQCINHQIFLP